MTRTRPSCRSFAADQRGTAMVEYTVILVVVAMGSVLAMVSLGGPLLSMLRAQQDFLLLPFP